VSVVANVAINVDSRGAVSKLRQVQTQSQQTERAVEGLSRAFGGLAAAFGAGFALTKVIADVKELDTNLRRLGTVGVDVAKISPALSKLSDELGGVASKAELAAASYQAASAGFSDTAGNINILRAATKAAVGGLADTQAVTEVLVKTLNSYGLAGDQAAKVTDSISKAVELGNQEWSDYTSQLGRVASIAALVGVSVDELNAFISSATLNGATAETAFTGLGATLSQIITPTKESQEAAAKLGIAWNYGGLQAKGFSGLMAELAIAMKKDKEAASRMVGPIEAARGAFAAASKDGSDFKNILEQIGGAAGKTDADFQTMKGSLENTLKALDTSFKNLSEALGTAFGPTVVIAVQDITKAVNGFADFMAMVPQPVMNTAGELVKLIIQLLLVEKAIKAIIALNAAFVAAQVAMAGATASTGAAATTSAGAFALYTNNARTLQATSVAATASVSGLAGALLGLAGIGIITVGINYVITQTGAIIGSSTAAGKSEAAGTAGGLAAQLKGKSAAERKQMLAAAQKNLANDEKLASALALQIQMQDNAALSSSERALPSDRSRLTELQARINTNQARIKAIQTTPIERAKPTPKPTPTPTPTPTSGGATGSSKAASAAKKAADEAKRLAEELQRSVERGDDLFRQFSRQAVLLGTTSETERKRLQIQYDYQDRVREINELKNAEQKVNLMAVNDEIRRLQTLGLQTEELKKQLEVFYELAGLSMGGMLPGGAGAFRTDVNLDPNDRAQQKIDEYKTKLAELQDPINMAQLGAQGIGDAFSSSFQGIITGTQTAQEALASFFQNIAKSFLDMATEIIAQMVIMYAFKQLLGLFGGGGSGIGAVGNFSGAFSGTTASFNPSSFGMGLLPGRAKGGPVSSGQAYMVGERGPELFVPGRSGTIVANDKMGGGSTNVIVNVDAKGSSVEGNEQGANQLGRVISAAVQSELIKQQRPGGLLAR
jgi:TP901 family phage tail tape measure protein